MKKIHLSSRKNEHRSARTWSPQHLVSLVSSEIVWSLQATHEPSSIIIHLSHSFPVFHCFPLFNRKAWEECRFLIGIQLPMTRDSFHLRCWRVTKKGHDTGDHKGRVMDFELRNLSLQVYQTHIIPVLLLLDTVSVCSWNQASWHAKVCKSINAGCNA